ncbi:MAG: T9SS type A sorting domain-containing protein [Cyclobacteriaceae bacterium]
MKKHYLSSLLILFLLLSAQMSQSQGLSDYCKRLTYHLDIPAEVGTEIFLTVSNIDANTIYVEIESADASPVTALIMDPAGETSFEDTNDGTKFRRTLTYATPPTNVNLVIQWSKASFGGNRIIRLNDVPFVNTCVVDPADDVSLSDLTIDGTTITGFTASKTSYTLEVAAGTTVVPTVVATATQSGTTAVVTPATSIPGTTTVLITSSSNQTATISIAFVINTPGVAAPTPIARSAGDVISVYSEAYTSTEPESWKTSWSPGELVAEEATIAGNKVRKYSNMNFAGIEMGGANALDVTQMTHIHIDMWTPNATKFGVKLVNIDGGNSEQQINRDVPSSSLRKWVGYDIRLSDYNNMTNKNKIQQFVLTSDQAGAHDEIMFIDNIYFYKGDIPTPIAALSQYCERSIFHENITDGSQTNTEIKLTISNIDATSMYIEVESATADPVTGINIDPINGIGGVVTNNNGVFRATFTFATAPTTISPIVQWAKEAAFGGNRIIRLSDLPFSASCTPPAPTTISASATTTADVTTGNLIIDAGQTYTVASGHTLTVLGDLSGAGQLVINSGASLITSDGKTIGGVMIKRNTRYADGKYSFVGTPVVASASITGADLGSFVYSYDETVAFGSDGLARWKDASATQLVPGVGYTQAMKQEITFTGVPNDGTITVAGLSHTAPDDKHSEHGWNILSNPYPAAIDVTKFLTDATNSAVLNGSVYLWDDQGSDAGRGDNGDYLTVNSLGEVGGPNGGVFKGYIGSMQGFFVKVASPTAGTSVQFTESMRVGGVNTDGTFFRKDEAHLLNVKLSLQSESGFYNETLIGFREDATQGVDRNYDADKLLADQDLQFYSVIDNNSYAIQGLPLQAGVSSELAFNLGEASDLTLAVESMTGLSDGMTIYLTDRVTGLVYNLSDVQSIDFTASAGSDQNRFTLTYASIADVLNVERLSNQPIYRYLNNELSVSFGSDLTVQEYAVYDLSGKTIVNKSLNRSVRELSIPVDSKGINIIKIVTEEGTFTRKFLF